MKIDRVDRDYEWAERVCIMMEDGKVHIRKAMQIADEDYHKRMAEKEAKEAK